MSDRIDFILHWFWTIAYGVLAITGIALMGAKYGWILNFNLSLADYLHRVTAAIWSVILLMAIGVEVYQRVKNINKFSFWLIVGPKDYQLITLFTALIFLVTGIYIWSGHNHSAAFVFNLWVHEVLTFVALGTIIWHIYDKAHALLLD